MTLYSNSGFHEAVRDEKPPALDVSPPVEPVEAMQVSVAVGIPVEMDDMGLSAAHMAKFTTKPAPRARDNKRSPTSDARRIDAYIDRIFTYSILYCTSV